MLNRTRRRWAAMLGPVVAVSFGNSGIAFAAENTVSRRSDAVVRPSDAGFRPSDAGFRSSDAGSRSSDAGSRPTTTGFYPLWENTGFVERHGEFLVSTMGAQYGIADRLHVGTLPVSYLYRTPNLYAKVSLWNKGPHHVAVQGGANLLLEGASRSMMSPLYPSWLDNPGFKVLIVPVAGAYTYEAANWLQLHQTLTMMYVGGLGEKKSEIHPGELKDTVTPGYMATAEFRAKSHHSFLLHAGEMGFWSHDFAVTGVSYRFYLDWLELRLGYFYRFRKEGTQDGPALGLGFLL